MSTSIVKKGANRAGHAVKTAKHAQRTPLAGSDRKEAQDPAVEAQAQDIIGAAYARAEARAAARTAPTQEEVVTDMPKKVADMAEAAESAGWDVAVSSEGDAHQVEATRDGEAVRVTFLGNTWSLNHRQVFVRKDGSEVLLRNASAAKKHMNGERAIASQRTATRAAAPIVDDLPAERPQQDLPFDPFEISDADLLTLLNKGAIIVWQNNARNRETAILMPGAKRLSLHQTPNGPANRAITFVSMPDGQYRSLSLKGMLRCDPLPAATRDEALATYRQAFNR